MFFEGMSDTNSIVSSVEDDKWGAQIGAYNEHHPSFPPPPATLLGPVAPDVLENAPTVNMEELEAMLDQGFDPHPPHNPLDTSPNRGNSGSILDSTRSGVLPDLPRSRYQLQDARNPSSQRPDGPTFDAFGPLPTALPPGGREPMPPRMRELSRSPGPNVGPPPLMKAAHSLSRSIALEQGTAFGAPPPLMKAAQSLSNSTALEQGHARRRSIGRGGGGGGEEDWGPMGPLGDSSSQSPSPFSPPQIRPSPSTLKKQNPSPRRI
jgi:chitin synthase